MGGTVAETIRRKDGTMHKMARRTGAYNFMFFSADWAKGNIEKAIDEHVKVFTEMKEDFEANQYSENYALNMSPVYGWCNETMPVDYGLVVIDFQTNKIHSCQGYDAPGRYLLGFYSPDDKEFYQVIFDKNNIIFQNYRGEEVGNIDSLFWAGAKFDDIEPLFQWDSITKPDGSVLSFDYLRSNQANQIAYKDFPFEILHYEESPEGYLSMLAALIDDGFTFNEEEVKGWYKYIEYYLDEAASYMPDLSEDEDVSDEQIQVYKTNFLNQMDALFEQAKVKSHPKP